MNVVGTCILTNIIPQDNCIDQEFVVFVDAESINIIHNILSAYKNKMSLYFYTQIDKEHVIALKKLDTNDIIYNISACSVAFTPISSYSAFGNTLDLISVLRLHPSNIYSSSDALKTTLNMAIEKCQEMNILYKNKNEYAMLISLDRSYDDVTPIIIPWRYESMLHFYGIHLSGKSFDDYIYDDIKYETYDNATKRITIEVESLGKMEFTLNKDNVQQVLEYQKKNKIVAKHANALKALKIVIEEKHAFHISKLEQSAITREITKEKLQLQLIKPSQQVVDIIYRSMHHPIKDDSIYMQHVPRIRGIIDACQKQKSYKPFVPVFPLRCINTVYIYISDFVTYQEVAEIERANKLNKVKFYLLSPKIMNYWSYVTMTNDDVLFCEHTYKMNTMYKKNNIIDIALSTSAYDKIANRLIAYETLTKVNYNVSRKDKLTEIIKLDDIISGLITNEYVRLKSVKTSNSLEISSKKVEIMKLNELVTTYKRIKHKNMDNDQFDSHKNKISHNHPIHETYELEHEQLLEQSHASSDQTAILNRRGEQIVELASVVRDVNQTFIDLQTLVEAQQLALDEIEINVLDAKDFVVKGIVELKEATVGSKTENKMIKGIAGTLMAGFVALVAFVGIKY